MLIYYVAPINAIALTISSLTRSAGLDYKSALTPIETQSAIALPLFTVIHPLKLVTLLLSDLLVVSVLQPVVVLALLL